MGFVLQTVPFLVVKLLSAKGLNPFVSIKPCLYSNILWRGTVPKFMPVYRVLQETHNAKKRACLQGPGECMPAFKHPMGR